MPSAAPPGWPVPGLQLDFNDFRAPDLAGDLAARDFTVNALAVPLAPLLTAGRARIVDPTGGRADLHARRLRPAGPGVLTDDPLRALRAVRLEATLGLTLTPAGARAVRAAAPGLVRVSAERVRDEMVALLALSATGRALRRADRLGVLEAVLPEIAPMRTRAQPAPHRFDVLEHSLRAVEACDRVLGALDALAPFGEELARARERAAGRRADRGARAEAGGAAARRGQAGDATGRGRPRALLRARLIGARRAARRSVSACGCPSARSPCSSGLVRQHLRPMHLGQAGQVTRRARYRFYRDLGPDTRDLLLLSLVDAAAVDRRRPARGLAARGPHPRSHDRLGRSRERGGGAAAAARAGRHDALCAGAGARDRQLLARAREAQDLGVVRTREEALAYLDSLNSGP